MTTPTLQTSIVAQDPTTQISLRPIQSVEAIVSAYQEYNKLKQMLLTVDDYQTIKGKTCIKKSGFRKLACAFGISIQVVKENRINFDKYFIYEVTCRATSPNGRYIEACSSCASNEKEFSHIENDVRATAQTRASNRSISDLIGGGEVSAEELDQGSHNTKLEDKSIPKQPQVVLTDTPVEKFAHANTQKYQQTPPIEYEVIKRDTVNPRELEDSEPHMKRFVHKNNTTYESPELMTMKQKNFLIKLIETRYQDEPTRATLFNRLKSLTKSEARDAIQKMLA